MDIPSRDMDLRQFITLQLMHLIMKYMLIIMVLICPFLTVNTRYLIITTMRFPIHLCPIMIMRFLILLCPTMNTKYLIPIMDLLLLLSPSCILEELLNLLMDLHQYLCTMKLSIMSLSLVTDLLQFTIILNQYLWLELWNLVTS